MQEELANTILMSEGTTLFIKALGGIVTGILVASGHLDVSNQDALSQNIQTGAGAIVTIISAYYILEHAYQAAKEELKWTYTPEQKTEGSTTTTEPQNTTPAPPAA